MEKFSVLGSADKLMETRGADSGYVVTRGKRKSFRAVVADALKAAPPAWKLPRLRRVAHRIFTSGFGTLGHAQDYVRAFS